MLKRILSLALFFVSTCFTAQDGKSKQELLRMLENENADTTVIDIYNELCWPVYSYDDADSSLYFGEKALRLANKIGDQRRLMITHRRVGITWANKGELKRAVRHQEQSHALAALLNDTRSMGLALNNIGVAYLNNDLLNKALENFLKSLVLFENSKDYRTISLINTNCGMIYRRSGELQRSKTFLLKAHKFASLDRDSDLIAISLCNLSNAYRNLNIRDSAKFYLAKAAPFVTENSTSNTKFHFKVSEGLLFALVGDHESSLRSFESAQNSIPTLSDHVTLLINLAEQKNALGKPDAAITHLKEAFKLSEKAKLYDNLEYISFMLGEIYQEKHNIAEFAKSMKLYIAYKDTNARVSRKQELLGQELEFEYQRKHVADSIRFEQKQNLKNLQLEVAEANLKKERNFKVMLIFVAIAVLGLAVFIYNRLLYTRRQKRVIERQKQIVEIKNHEIMDSITYARRLQFAIMPQVSVIRKDLDFEVLYLPKDVIGGDFYFFEKYADHLFLAVNDCTGHGVPGAIMSVVCHTAMEKSIKEYDLTDPAAILEQTRALVIDNLNALHQNIKDGMDCSIVVINLKTREMKWAGANNPLWIIENGTFREIKADKQPVGAYENAAPFKSHTLKLEKDSLLYLITDGYADQFGGVGAKKFKNKSLKDLLQKIASLKTKEQVEQLHEHFNKWKGTLDQVDDVTIGILRV
jgi:serine phosphatase RsbU (regulator of sigma subunit)